MDNIVHLGHEYDGVSPYMAEELLAEGKLVSFVGIGPSMEPVIPDRTRMVFRPFDPRRERVEVGEVYFCRAGQWGFDNHMCLSKTRRIFISGTPDGYPIARLKVKNIRGIYVGDWRELCLS